MGGYSGSDIVQENLRQLCVFHLANASGEPWRWWQYVTKFADECKMSDNKYTESCAEQVSSGMAFNARAWPAACTDVSQGAGVDGYREPRTFCRKVASKTTMLWHRKSSS